MFTIGQVIIGCMLGVIVCLAPYMAIMGDTYGSSKK